MQYHNVLQTFARCSQEANRKTPPIVSTKIRLPGILVEDFQRKAYCCWYQLYRCNLSEPPQPRQPLFPSTLADMGQDMLAAPAHRWGSTMGSRYNIMGFRDADGNIPESV